jgi:tetratricopeptide (TPR) repeat protein
MNDYILSTFYFYAGAVYTLLGNFKEAEIRLTKALEIGQENSNERVNAASCAYMSYLYNTVGKRKPAAEYAISAVRFMMKTRQKKFQWSMPEISHNMLQYAHDNGTTAEYTEDIAFNQYNISFSNSGEMIPVMLINAFGEIEIKVGDKALSPEQLSGNFRTMIAILLSSKNYTAHQEVIQSYIWPSSGKEHARKSFDNLMSRFRKLISTNFDGITPKDYITINNGIVRLSNVRCNADDFINKISEAGVAFENREFTKSLCSLLSIKDTYSERYFAFINDIEKIDAKRQYTDSAMIDMMTLIYRMNSYIPDIIPLEPYLDKWQDIFIHETEMVRLAYLYYKDKNDKVKCFSIIKNFKIYLTNEGFSNDEISELIYAVKS